MFEGITLFVSSNQALTHWRVTMTETPIQSALAVAALVIILALLALI
jgi:hypothetical protein